MLIYKNEHFDEASMDIIDKILKEHSVILEIEETRRETYGINEDIEVGIHHTKDNIYVCL